MSPEVRQGNHFAIYILKSKIRSRFFQQMFPFSINILHHVFYSLQFFF